MARRPNASASAATTVGSSQCRTTTVNGRSQGALQSVTRREVPTSGVGDNCRFSGGSVFVGQGSEEGEHRMRNLIRGLTAAVLLAALPVISDAGVLIGVSVNIAPPVLPVYVQPPCPAAGYIWIPGYWAWGDEDYYWVPGTSALAPAAWRRALARRSCARPVSNTSGLRRCRDNMSRRRRATPRCAPR